METNLKTEEKIIEAATVIFLEKGKDGARMQEIADRAGINKALLHYYFRSKEKLYEEVFRNELRNFFRSILETIKESEDLKEFIQTFINLYIDSISKNPKLFRFILWEIEKGGKNLTRILLEIMHESNFRVQQVLDKIQDEISNNRIREIDPPNLWISVIGMCLFPFIAKPILETILPVEDVTSPEFLAKRKQEIFNLIWNGIKKD